MQQPFHRYTIYGGYPSNINNFFCKGHPQRSIVSIKQNKFSYATTLTWKLNAKWNIYYLPFSSQLSGDHATLRKPLELQARIDWLTLGSKRHSIDSTLLSCFLSIPTLNSLFFWQPGIFVFLGSTPNLVGDKVSVCLKLSSDSYL